MMFIQFHSCMSKQQKLKTEVVFLKLILLIYIILFLEERTAKKWKTNNNKNSFVGSRTGIGPWEKKTGVIYLSAVMHVYIPPWAIPLTIEMVPPASSVSVSSPELDHVPWEEML